MLYVYTSLIHICLPLCVRGHTIHIRALVSLPPSQLNIRVFGRGLARHGFVYISCHYQLI